MMTQFFKLNYREKAWFCEAWIRFLVWHLRIKLQPYNQWKAKLFIEPEHVIEPTNTLPAGLPTKLTATIEQAGRNHVILMNCLRRCLVTRDMLHRRSIPTKLHFGMRVCNGKAEAHCWLSCNGRLVNDSAEVVNRYAELQSVSVFNSLLTNMVTKGLTN
ncbi:lasso peptide biosynthesis B2 protein [Salinimonas marina]|uniref:Lasso peptide biosynthesis B2 protein n=1 Tax=Salinimonas marina TaxID=2785918 RepID=A0A7S9DWH4_9ALTE|nr:lasso peptide biosynthesis B2 protein [Salinimonas marina]QPG05145.1 lasso peptide biosynthesis B2 protein [Salinimonas marina]